MFRIILIASKKSNPVVTDLLFKKFVRKKKTRSINCTYKSNDDQIIVFIFYKINPLNIRMYTLNCNKIKAKIKHTAL